MNTFIFDSPLEDSLPPFDGPNREDDGEIIQHIPITIFPNHPNADFNFDSVEDEHLHLIDNIQFTYDENDLDWLFDCDPAFFDISHKYTWACIGINFRLLWKLKINQDKLKTHQYVRRGYLIERSFIERIGQTKMIPTLIKNGYYII